MENIFNTSTVFMVIWIDEWVILLRKSFYDTLNTLLCIEETTVLEHASYAIGEQGITGRTTPAALLFCKFAL